MVGKICTVCRRCSYVEKRLSFFTYPRDVLRRHEWLSAVNRLDLLKKLDNLKTRSNYRICEVHFEKKFVQRCKINKRRKSLTKDAFPTLALPNRLIPMTNRNYLKPPSFQYAQNMNLKVQDGHHLHVKQYTRNSKYNLRPIKQENRLQESEEDEYSDESYKVTKKVYVKVNRPQSPPFCEDLSVFCESIIKVSQSTQTPRNTVINVINKRQLNDPIVTTKVKTEEASNATFLQMCNKFLSPSLAKLVKWNLSTVNGKQHVNFTLFALNLYYSSNIYNLLKDMLSLPSRNTLKYFLLQKSTKLSVHFLNAFRCKINNMSTKERICSFSVGSLMLKPNLYYNINYDRIIGFHDINGVQNAFFAKYAVLLMVQGILDNWKQPIAYAFISKYDNIPEISTWIDEVLTALIDIGLDIRVFVSDPRSEFLYASKSRFVTPEKSYFTINGTDIFYAYDSSQLLKIVRNNIRSCDFYCGSNPRNNEDILTKIENLCNVLKSKTRFTNCQYKSAFSNKPYQRYFLNEMIQLFQNLKMLRKSDGVDVTENMKFIQAFQITINSVLQLFEELNFLGVKYLLTSRLSHNCLNRFFAHVKHNCKEECTPRQFNRSFVRSLVFNILKKPVRDNVESSLDAEEFSQQLHDEDVLNTESISNTPLLVRTTDYRYNLPEKNAFVYVCGYCYLKCIQIHDCDTFQFYVDGYRRKQSNDELAYFCSVSLDLNVEKCKMLPPDDFTEFIMLLERKFKEFLKEHTQIRSIGQEMLKEFEPYGFGMPCPCFPIDYLKALFIRIRLFYTIRKNNKLLIRKRSVKSLRIFSL